MAVTRVLFASSEIHPIIKTGGLADVSGSLPPALKTLRRDLRIIIPAYQEALKKLGKTNLLATLTIDGVTKPVRLLEGHLPGTSVPLWLVDAPALFNRPGNPYLDSDGHNWPDNAQRFTAFARTIVAIALGKAGLNWQPQLVHCNDWQTGLVPALLSQHVHRPATVFTIHNLAYQGLFPWDTFQALKLPEQLWSMHALEFYGQCSFIKGGLIFADQVNTVSPQYAQEICTTEYGCGLEHLLSQLGPRLSGILNGADYSQWNPARDPHLKHRYNAHHLPDKQLNKTDLQRRFGLPIEDRTPLIGMIGRLVEQKGFDLVLQAMPKLMAQDVQLFVLGSGETALEESLRQAKKHYPDQIAAQIGYDETLAHQIEGSADMFLMPSRFEPCGLNQIYSLRYGTLPIVRRTGGLANTVIHANENTLSKGVATGITFDTASPVALSQAVQQAMTLYHQPRLWKKLLFRAMQQDFSWRRSARQYLELYNQAVSHPNRPDQV